MKQLKLMLGDNISSLKKLPDNCIDSIVTDPPYGLKFMGKKWDYQVPSTEFWLEVYRVLKPGGHILSFGGTRTYHRMVVNLEDAGFEIRDCISWLYSTGFPKALDIEKQMLKNGYKICECEKKPEHELRSVPSTNISQTINNEIKQGEVLLNSLSQQSLEQNLCEMASNDRRQESSLEGRNNLEWKEGELQPESNKICEGTGLANTNGEAGRIYTNSQDDNSTGNEETSNQNGGGSSQGSRPIKQPNTQLGTMADEQGPQVSRSWEVCSGCNKPIIQPLKTALKPAQELICLARKPISEKTIALNVLKWGTGGLNIDECRIGIEGGGTVCNNRDENGECLGHSDGGLNLMTSTKHSNNKDEFNEGRFPANIILDEEAGKDLDRQSGITKTKKTKPPLPQTQTSGFIYKNTGPTDIITERGFDDQGGASRYFYSAKVSKKERNMGLDGFEDKESILPGLNSFNENGDRLRSDGSIIPPIISKNTHPTIKPITLMSYLIKLITPTNGIVLDPFMGSGSTGIAAQLNGFRFCGMEMDESYFKIAEARINNFELYREFLDKKKK